jgi:hypothetical protein
MLGKQDGKYINCISEVVQKRLFHCSPALAPPADVCQNHDQVAEGFRTLGAMILCRQHWVGSTESEILYLLEVSREGKA